MLWSDLLTVSGHKYNINEPDLVTSSGMNRYCNTHTHHHQIFYLRDRKHLYPLHWFFFCSHHIWWTMLLSPSPHPRLSSELCVRAAPPAASWVNTLQLQPAHPEATSKKKKKQLSVIVSSACTSRTGRSTDRLTLLPRSSTGGQVQPHPAASSDVELASCRLEGNDGFESRGADIHLKML